MNSEVRRKADYLASHCDPMLFAGRNVGLEKETLRVAASGDISQKDHPEALGRALTHPYITTDFSEALLEMVTPPCASAEQSLDFLLAVHHFIARRLPANEHLWNTSMPCVLHGADSVRIGEYGNSHSGRMKHAYRRGLGLRYGKRMQAIAGIHFNFSMPDEAWLTREQLATASAQTSGQTSGDKAAAKTDAKTSASTGSATRASIDDTAEQWRQLSATSQQQKRTTGYFEMMQNMLRIGWIVPYLFGASPAICSSFLGAGEGEELDVFNGSTRFAPHGTSLRMGKIGYRYREDQPIDLSVRHTSVDAYIADIIAHVSTEHPAYRELGLRDANDQFQQLSTSRLQIENEYYSSVRPKQIAQSGELPIHALRERGIRYLELRSVDVNVLEPAGLGLAQIAMLEMLMMYAWLAPPAPLADDALPRIRNNLKTVAHYGRKPGLQLDGEQGPIALRQWGEEIMHALEPVAAWLDEGRDEPLYVASLEQQKAKFADPDCTPSAMVLAGIRNTGSFLEHTQDLSRQHQADFMAATPDDRLMRVLQDKVGESLVKQAQMEGDSQGSFEFFLEQYLNQMKSPESVGV